MKILIIIPFYNESSLLTKNIKSFLNQSYSIDKIVMVDDNSSDNSYQIVKSFELKHDNLQLLKKISKQNRIPGQKIVDAFNYGLKHCNLSDYDLIGKFDSDLILPKNYFEVLVNEFRLNNNIGMSSGHLYINKNGKWMYENISNKDKIRGPIKLYRVDCFKEIGGLRNCIGWDTIDELLVKYNGWETKLVDLKVKHLRPTGLGYKKIDAKNFGKSLHNLRYDVFLAFLSALKMSYKKRSLTYFIISYFSFLKSIIFSKSKAINNEQGRFIRQYRWKQIRRKLWS